MPQNDELIQTLIRNEMTGKLEAPPKPVFPASPAHVQVPRRKGFDLVNRLAGGEEDLLKHGPIGALLRGLGIFGVAAPLSLAEHMLDQYSPKMEARDVKLPNESGYDPALLERMGIK